MGWPRPRTVPGSGIPTAHAHSLALALALAIDHAIDHALALPRLSLLRTIPSALPSLPPTPCLLRHWPCH